ncbi:alanine racemase, partial [Streptomyces sp. NPDC096080]|uniref:alanine racemase n=1 Tax=Streptomyces sp. NPDC096080 TaxID=3156693 RepID=UPI00333141BE
MNETVTAATAPLRARAEIDLGALRANVRALRALAPDAALMAVVKSQAYGHGALRCARAAVEAGATWVGTATPVVALALLAAGLPGGVRLMCWLWTPGGPWREAVEAGIDVSVSGMWALAEVTAAARAAGVPARVQLKAVT